LALICGPEIEPRILLKDPRSLPKVVENVGVRETLGVIEDSKDQILP
jgi:hypothetical protein